MWRLDEQKQLLRDVLAALLDPLGVEAKGYRERAIEAYNFGWYDDALHFFLEAEKRVRVDFIVDHYIGNIYLFVDNHRDYTKAAEYFEKAARYARPKSIRHTIYALMYKGLAHYLSGSQDDPRHYKAAVESIQSALAIASREKALHFIPEIQYQLAQYNVVAGNHDGAAVILRELLMTNPSYTVKVIAEEDFLLAKAQVVEVIEAVGADLQRSISEELDRHALFLSLVQRDRSGYYDLARMAAYVGALKLISEKQSQGDFGSLIDAKGLLESVSIPISHPRQHGFSVYSTLYRTYITMVYSYLAPYNSRHPYRSQLWAMGGELL
jgi:tetratricopeptide (TPR) repeat protein